MYIAMDEMTLRIKEGDLSLWRRENFRRAHLIGRAHCGKVFAVKDVVFGG
jgi:hypothetical protein